MRIRISIIAISSPRNPNLLELRPYCDEFIVFPAVRPADLNVTEDTLMNRRPQFNGSHYLSTGEAACAKSHLEVTKLFLKSDMDLNLTLEDDVFLPKLESVKRYFDDLKCQRFEGNNLIYAGGMEGMKMKPYFDIRRLFIKGRLRKFETRFLYRASSYITNRSSALGLVNYLSKSPGVVADDWMGLIEESGTKITYAPLFYHPRNITNSALEAGRHGK